MALKKVNNLPRHSIMALMDIHGNYVTSFSYDINEKLWLCTSNNQYYNDKDVSVYGFPVELTQDEDIRKYRMAMDITYEEDMAQKNHITFSNAAEGLDYDFFVCFSGEITFHTATKYQSFGEVDDGKNVYYSLDFILNGERYPDYHGNADAGSLCYINSIKFYSLRVVKHSSLGNRLSKIPWKEYSSWRICRPVEESNILEFWAETEAGFELFDLLLGNAESCGGGAEERLGIIVSRNNLLGLSSIDIEFDDKTGLVVFKNEDLGIFAIFDEDAGDTPSREEIQTIVDLQKTHYVDLLKLCGRDPHTTNVYINRYLQIFGKLHFGSLILTDYLKEFQPHGEGYILALTNGYHHGQAVQYSTDENKTTYKDEAIVVSRLLDSNLHYPLPNLEFVIENGSKITDRTHLLTDGDREEVSKLLGIGTNEISTCPFSFLHKVNFLYHYEKIYCKIILLGYNNDDKSFLSCLMYFSSKKKDIDAINRLRPELFEYITILSKCNQLYLDAIRKEKALSVSISAIMSRNMSHNLGSHFLNYTKTDILLKFRK